MKKRLSYNFVKEKFEREGYVLLSKEYKNANIHLELICPNGHRITKTYSNFKSGKGCTFCSHNASITYNSYCSIKNNV